MSKNKTKENYGHPTISESEILFMRVYLNNYRRRVAQISFVPHHVVFQAQGLLLCYLAKNNKTL